MSEDRINRSLIDLMEAEITPDNIALGHTWLKRKVREIIRQHTQPAGDVVEAAFQAALKEFGSPDDEFNCWHMEEGGLRKLVFDTIAAMGDASTRKDEEKKALDL